MRALDTVVHYLTQGSTFGEDQEAREAIADLIQAAVSEEYEPVRERVDALEAKLEVSSFQRAVIGGLVLIAQAAQQSAAATAFASGTTLGPISWIDSQESSAAARAIAPFLDETPRPA